MVITFRKEPYSADSNVISPVCAITLPINWVNTDSVSASCPANSFYHSSLDVVQRVSSSIPFDTLAAVTFAYGEALSYFE
jgi:hypothetical protein